jgi:DNA-nicking Smr family endonuclease
METYNKRAADIIFASHNPAAERSLAQVDLHGLYVQEALSRVESHIAACRNAGIKSTVVVTGRGNRSRDGLAKIKPAVETFLKKENLRAELGIPNEGCVTVWLDVKEEETGWGCVVM